MAHLPETAESVDALGSADPVVREPKVMIKLVDPATYRGRSLVAISLLGLGLGGLLGGAGIAIVYATRVPRAYAAAPRSMQRVATTLTAADGGVASGVFALPTEIPDAGHPVIAPTLPSPTAGTPTGALANFTVAQQRLGRGRTLPQVLQRLGLDRSLALHIGTALHSLLNMRSLQPTDDIVIFRDPAIGNEPRRVEYRRSETQVWAVTIAPDRSCSAERIDVVKTTQSIGAGFVVGDSLQQTLAAANLDEAILPRIQESFAALDLPRELHRGDSVRLIVSEDRLNGTFFRYGPILAIDYHSTTVHRRGFFQHIGHGGEFFDSSGISREGGPLHAPLDAPRVTSQFNPHRMHPILHRIMPHQGTDFGAPVGTPVYSAADGVVLSIDHGGPTGNLVRVSHAALGIETGYAHLSRFASGLHAGDHVHVHQVVGYVGSTGRSTGPHLHMSCKRHDEFFDCMTLYHPRRSVPTPVRGEFDTNVQQYGAQLDAIRLDGEPAAAPVATEPAPPPGEAPPPATEEPPADDPNAPTE